MPQSSCQPTPGDVLDALSDPRVLRVLELALRDRAIRREFSLLRLTMSAGNAILALSDAFFLSEEHIRTIIYRKREEDRVNREA